MNPNDSQQDQWPDDPLLDSLDSQGQNTPPVANDLRNTIDGIGQDTDEILDILRDGQQQPVPRAPQPQQRRRKRSVNSVIDQIVDQVSSQVTQDIAAAQPAIPSVADHGMARSQRQRHARGRWISNTPPVTDIDRQATTSIAAKTDQSPVGQPDPTAPSGSTKPNSQGRQRDASGRWLPSGQPTTDITTRNRPSAANDGDADQVGRTGESPAYWDKLAHAVGQGMQDATQGVDPTVEALREAGVFRAVTWVFGKKDKLPKEQSKHNRLVERLLRRMTKEGSREGGGGSSWMILLRLAPLLLAGIAAGLSAMSTVIAAAMGAALVAWLAAKAVSLFGGGSDNGSQEPVTSKSPAAMSWKERWLTLKSSFGSESARQELREKYPDSQAGYYGMPMGSYEAAQQRLQGGVGGLDQGGALGALIGSGEGDYNSFNRGVAGDSRNEKIDFSNMTVGELMRRQKLPVGHRDRIAAAGKYQVIKGTMREAVQKMRIDPNAKFNPELQERIFAEYLVDSKRPAMRAYRLGKSDDSTSALYDASKEFASIAVPKGLPTKSGRISNGTTTYYDTGKGGNRASIMPHQVLAAMNKDREALKLPSVPKPTVTPQKQVPIGQAEGQALLDQFMPSNKMAIPTVPQTKVITPAIPYRPQYQPAPKLPAQPQTSQRINTPQSAVPATSMSDDSMTQNVGDRQLAHLITGGLGMGGHSV
jgi:hypothetical protein